MVLAISNKAMLINILRIPIGLMLGMCLTFFVCVPTLSMQTEIIPRSCGTLLASDEWYKVMSRYLQTPEDRQKNTENWAWFDRNEARLVSDMPTSLEHAYRGMVLGIQTLREILTTGMKVTKGHFGEIDTAYRPKDALFYSFTEGTPTPVVKTDFLSVIFQIDIRGLKYMTNGIGYAIQHDIQPNQLSRVWVYDKVEQKFVEISLKD